MDFSTNRGLVPESRLRQSESADDPLVHFNVNPEVYAPEGSRGGLGLAMRDIRVVLLAP